MPHTEQHRRGAFQKGYSIEDLIGPNFIERYQNRELGKETIDDILGGLEQDWNNLDEDTRQNIVGAANWVGDAYSRARSIDETEKYNPIAYAEAGALRTIEGAVNVIGGAADMTLGNLGRGAGWMMGLDPRAREALAVGSQIYLGPKAFRNVANLTNKAITSKQAHNLAFKAGQYADEVLGSFKPASQRTITIKDYATIIDETRQIPSQEFQRIVKLAKQPGINSFTLAKRFNEQQGVIKEYLKKFGYTKTDLQGALDPLDIPVYKKAPLDLNTAVHPTTYDGINTINTLLNKHGGLVNARLNLKSVNTKGNVSKRILSSVFLTPYGKGGNFEAIKRNKKSVFYTMFGTEYEKMGLTTKMKSGQATEPIQGHHGDSPLAVVLPGFEGTVKESPKYNRFVNVFFDEMLALGDMPENIRIVYGHVTRDPDAPHALSHAFGDFKLGKSGQEFWTKEKLDQIVVYDKDGNAIGTKNDDLREKFIRDQIVILKENIEVLDNAMEQYKLLYGKKPLDPIELVDYFETKLPGIRDTELGGYLPMIMDKFVTGTVLEEAATVQANPITKADAKQIIANIFETENVRQWRKWSVPKRKARMAEITGGYSFERLEELIDKGWMDGNRLNKLFEDPLDDLK